LNRIQVEQEFEIDENGWCSAYATGDLVKVNNNKLGIVMGKNNSPQKSMFPFVKVMLLEDSNVYDYGLNSLEIVSKANP
jgi:hypothetical protein